MGDLIYKVPVAEHNRMIAHAKTLIHRYLEAKWELCEIALKLCHVPNKKGGRIQKGTYTITNFADDIGMNRKTLSCWMLDYEVYSKLNIETKGLTMQEAKKLNGAIGRTRIQLFNMDHMHRSDIRETDPKKVQRTFDAIMNEDPLIQRLNDFKKYLKHQRYTLEHETFKAKHRASLEEYQDYLYQITRQLRKVLNTL